MNTLQTADLKAKIVFYRPDYNVPLQDGVIQDDFRITSTKPTLDYLMEQGCKIVIGTHSGRPEGEDPTLSLRPIAHRLADLYSERTVRFANKLDEAEIKKSLEEMEPGDIILLENLRFFKEEEANDQSFAARLASLAEVYVNDAFACDHRAHASIVGIPAILPGYAGFLLEKEVTTLGGLMEDPAKPFVVVMGGAKVSDKIEVIQSLGKVADTLLIGGAMANTFLLAKGEDVSASKVEADKVDLAKQLSTELGEKLVLANDYVKEMLPDGTFRYMDIGSNAVEQFKEILGKAKTVFWNGSLGYAEDERFAVASEAIAKYIGSLNGITSVVAGGDTVGMISNLGLSGKFSFISTGGGAALELLAGKELPGVVALTTK